jgi:hypothetical protein
MTTTNVPIPPPPEPEQGGGRRSRSLRIAGVAFVVIVGGLAFTEWGRQTLLPFLVGLAIIFGIPASVGAIRMAGHPPGERGRRFASGFFVSLGIEVVLVVISFGICVAVYSSGGG